VTLQIVEDIIKMDEDNPNRYKGMEADELNLHFPTQITK
jgi:hypothetical protein